MIRYEVTLPESGCKMTGVAESADALKHLWPWKVRITGEVPVTALEPNTRLEHLVLDYEALEQVTLERLRVLANQEREN